MGALECSTKAVVAAESFAEVPVQTQSPMDPDSDELVAELAPGLGETLACDVPTSNWMLSDA